jgi:hypothetical protein
MPRILDINRNQTGGFAIDRGKAMGFARAQPILRANPPYEVRAEMGAT